MDQERLDRWARALSNSASRRGAVAAAASVAAGWMMAGEAKKKKRKKKKGKPGKPGGACRLPLQICTSDAQCCLTDYSPEQPICHQMFANQGKQCCVPHHAPIDFVNSACCGQYDEDAPGGGRRCCIDMGRSDEGHPEFCCRDYPSINGFCCVESGFGCNNGVPCCNGGVCTNGQCP